MALLALGLAAMALGCVVVGALWDIARFEIPDSLSIAIIALFVPYALLSAGPIGWLDHLGGVALIFAIGLLLFWRGWMGGGDVKLLTAIALWTGLSGLPGLLIGTTLAGGVLAALLLALRALPIASGSPGRRPHVLQAGAPLPYGVAIAAGTFYWLSTVPMPAL